MATAPPRTVAIVQARMGSTRLPGKVLEPLLGRPMLEHVIRRVQASRHLQAVCVATSTLPPDDAIVEVARSCEVQAFRGSEDDVLSRYSAAARAMSAGLVVRITADCPLYDAALLDEMLQARTALDTGGEPIAYYSNCIRRTYPRGLDTEVVLGDALHAADREARMPAEREHVTPFIVDRPQRFRRLDHLNPEGDWSALRWTVDTNEDLELVRRIYEGLGKDNVLAGRAVVKGLVDRHPEWHEINAHVQQKPLDGRPRP